jgi:hypothetical protein
MFSINHQIENRTPDPRQTYREHLTSTDRSIPLTYAPYTLRMVPDVKLCDVRTAKINYVLSDSYKFKVYLRQCKTDPSKLN